MSILEKVLEYNKLRDQEKLLKTRKDDLAKEIKEYVKEKGNKDSKGSYYTEQGNFVCGNVARKTMKLNEEKAKALLNERGLYRDAIQIVEKVDEDKLAQLVASGELSLDDIEAVTDVKVSYSIDVKEKKEEDEVIPTIDVAPREASTKKKLVLKKRVAK